MLLVHRGLVDGGPLQGRFRLLLMDRFGYGRSEDRPDDRRIAADVEAIVSLMSGGAHLVGHSYGGLICILAATSAPASVLSLTLIEPPAFSLVRGDPDVEDLIARLAVALPAARGMAPPAAVQAFFEALGLVGIPPTTAAVERATRSTFRELAPWELDVPLAPLKAAQRRTLVVSGGWAGDVSNRVRYGSGKAFEKVCDVLADHLNARHAVIAGATHAVQFTGPPFNALLDRFIG